MKKVSLLMAACVLMSSAAHAADGKSVYEQGCFACHASGVLGAPKLGDKAAWASRLESGKEALYASAINGKGTMPPKGGFNGSDAEIKAAVDYMINASK